MLGDFFGVGEEFGTGGRVVIGRDPERLVPARGFGDHGPVVVNRDHELGTEPGGREIAERQQKRTGRGVVGSPRA